MRRIVTWTLLPLVALALAAGCRTPHLGEEYGYVSRRAFEAQASSRTSEAPGPLDAKDVKEIMAKHHATDTQGMPPQGQGAPPQPMPELR
jgi:hypothetical protein